MGLLSQARADAKHIIEQGGFQVDLSFVSKDGLETATIKGLGMKHRAQVDGEDQVINIKEVNITFFEQTLVDSPYTVRDSKDEVSLKGHKVTYTDSAGFSKTYLIDETFPDETLGNITCILKDFE